MKRKPIDESQFEKAKKDGQIAHIMHVRVTKAMEAILLEMRTEFPGRVSTRVMALALAMTMKSIFQKDTLKFVDFVIDADRFVESIRRGKEDA